MAVTTTTTATAFLGSGSASQVCPFTYRALDEDFIKVSVLEDFATADVEDDTVILVKDTDYTVSLNADGTGSVTLLDTWTAADRLVVYRQTAQTQEDTLTPGLTIPGPAVEGMDDKAMMILQELNTRLLYLEGEPNALFIPDDEDNLDNIPQIFANTAARTAAVPAIVGQLGFQVDTATLYYGTATTAGSWTKTTQAVVRVFANLAALQAATPDYVGQIAIVEGAPQIAAQPAKYGIYRGYGLTSDDWYEIHPTSVHGVWNMMPWRSGEMVSVTTTCSPRWCGSSGLKRWLDTVTVMAEKPGPGSLTLNLYIKSQNGNRQNVLSNGPMVISSAEVKEAAGSGATFQIVSGLKTGGAGVLYDDALEVEVVSVGTSFQYDATVGNRASTLINTAELAKTPTGSLVSTAEFGNTIVTQIADDAVDYVTFVHPANAAGSLSTGFVHGRVLAIMDDQVSYAASAVSVTVKTPYATRVRIGDAVLGLEFEPGTVVTSINTGTGAIGFSKATIQAGSVVTFMNPDRPTIQAFIDVIGNTDSVVTLPTVSGVKVGDGIIDPDGDLNSYVTDITGNDVTFAAGASGDIIRFFFEPPRKTVTGTGGTTTLTASEGTGIRIGALIVPITGVVAPETYVLNVSGVTITTSKALPLSLSSKVVMLARDNIMVLGALTSSSSTAVMNYAIDSTEITVGMLMCHPYLAPGTFVSSVAGSNVTLSKAALGTGTNLEIGFKASPVWQGLSITAQGFTSPLLNF